ncbi:NTP transferase domain-containing protein [Aquamicrobium segne]|uniref:NTP transferase domain-containing protein n=1 Tax=Aquamicrobium segne TaxID=469547 RepID=A0ABW0H6L9_9HYPH
MKYGPVPIDQAQGALLAHSITASGKRIRKAHILSAEDIETLRAAHIEQVVVAILEEGDIEENEAATRIAAALEFSGAQAKPATTGRVSIFAERAGLFTVNKALVDAINEIDPDATLATLAPYVSVTPGQMIATLKIIPFAMSSSAVEAIVQLAAGRSAFAVHAFQPHQVGLVQTVLPGMKESVLDKTSQTTKSRLLRSGSNICDELRTPHTAKDVADAIHDLAARSDMVLIFGASSLSDPEDDVIPAAIRASGGKVLRSGMPVDPGNLFVLGEHEGKPVLGAPGCARSARPNGFDWALDRIFAGIGVTSHDIAAMGVGGLLMEIPSRPQPRGAPPPSDHPKVHAVVLAAGRSSRMGGPNKMLALFDDEPLVHRTAARVLATKADGALLVTGHQRELVEAALQDLDLRLVHNPAFADGLSTSLKTAIAAVPDSADGALIVLGDMPNITSEDMDLLIHEFRTSGGTSIVRAVSNGKRGNPVILPRSLFETVAGLHGDIGARHLVETSELDIIDVEIGADAAVDVDTPEALAKAGGRNVV